MLMFVLTLKSYGQTDSIGPIVERILEFYLENNEIEDFDNNTAFERLYDFGENPLNLNKATAAEFQELFFLTPVEIQAIIDHRNTYGDFLAVEELQTIDALSITTARMMLPFCMVGERGNFSGFREIIAAGKSQLFLKYRRTLEDKAGYFPNSNGETRYLGDPNYGYIRYRFNSGRRLKAGFTAEKDAGEQFFGEKSRYGFDFYSAYAYAEKLTPWLEQLSLGDYTMSMGQGLILHNGFGYGKSAFVTSFKKNNQHLRQYSSVNENLYFRGAGATVKIVDQLRLTLAYSYKKIDGSIDLDTIDNSEPEAFFSSLLQGGLHRTSREVENKGSITQQNVAGVLEYRFKGLKLGLNHLQYYFSAPLQRDPVAYRRFYFNGDRLFNTSADYDYTYKNVNIFGEWAMSDNGGKAMSHNALIALSRRADVAVNYRKFDKDYQVLEANAFSEGSLPIDEQALYIGAEIRPNNEWKLSAYQDIWKHEWLRYRVDAPSAGKEFLARIEYNKKRKFNAYVMYRYEQKQRNSSLNTEKIDPLTDFTIQKLRVHFSQKVNKDLEFKARAEVSQANSDNKVTLGNLLFFDVLYKPIGRSFDVIGRYALFDANGFDSRVYMYENDLLYEYSIPFFQNKGRRFYLIYRQNLARGLTLETKFSQTIFQDIDEISSGTELISGPSKTDFKVQLRWSF